MFASFARLIEFPLLNRASLSVVPEPARTEPVNDLTGLEPKVSGSVVAHLLSRRALRRSQTAVGWVQPRRGRAEGARLGTYLCKAVAVVRGDCNAAPRRPNLGVWHV